MTQEPSTKSEVAAGTSIVAAIVLITVGVLQFFQGIAALAKDEVFVVGVQYVYKFDLTTWGWIHLILGVVVVLVGIALLTGATWARIVAGDPAGPVDRGEFPAGSRTTRGGRSP